MPVRGAGGGLGIAPTGLRHVFTGDIHDPGGQGTYRHGCGALLIGRDRYDITAWHLAADGRCAGVFEEAPGDWGRRRVPLNVRAVPAGGA